jgi:hypothetical protein
MIILAVKLWVMFFHFFKYFPLDHHESSGSIQNFCKPVHDCRAHLSKIYHQVCGRHFGRPISALYIFVLGALKFTRISWDNMPQKYRDPKIKV